MAWWWIPIVLVIGILIGMMGAAVMISAHLEDERRKITRTSDRIL